VIRPGRGAWRSVVALALLAGCGDGTPTGVDNRPDPIPLHATGTILVDGQPIQEPFDIYVVEDDRQDPVDEWMSVIPQQWRSTDSGSLDVVRDFFGETHCSRLWLAFSNTQVPFYLHKIPGCGEHTLALDIRENLTLQGTVTEGGAPYAYGTIWLYTDRFIPESVPARRFYGHVTDHLGRHVIRLRIDPARCDHIWIGTTLDDRVPVPGCDVLHTIDFEAGG